MQLTWKATNRRSLTMWVLIAIALLSGGCHNCRWNCYKCLVNPYVCPTCPAKSVEQCHCYTAVENAGYCETTWAPLGGMREVDLLYVPTSTEEIRILSPPVQTLDTSASHADGDGAVMQASAESHPESADPESADPESADPESEWVAEAQWETESQIPTDDSGRDDVTDVADEYQPLAEYFRAASE